MSTSAAGTMENPGVGVKAKSGLNKAILDQGWYEFARQLAYKLRCSTCGNVDGRNRRSQADFECVACGRRENADLNAARNILAAGRAVLACGEEALVFSVKQEPTVSATAIA